MGFKVGDKVIYLPNGQAGTIDAVTGNIPGVVGGKTYTISLPAGLLSYDGVLESDITMDLQQGFVWDLSSGSAKDPLCDCGAHKVYGFENCHSFWCSAYKG